MSELRKSLRGWACGPSARSRSCGAVACRWRCGCRRWRCRGNADAPGRARCEAAAESTDRRARPRWRAAQPRSSTAVGNRRSAFIRSAGGDGSCCGAVCRACPAASAPAWRIWRPRPGGGRRRFAWMPGFWMFRQHAPTPAGSGGPLSRHRGGSRPRIDWAGRAGESVERPDQRRAGTRAFRPNCTVRPLRNEGMAGRTLDAFHVEHPGRSPRHTFHVEPDSARAKLALFHVERRHGHSDLR